MATDWKAALAALAPEPADGAADDVRDEAAPATEPAAAPAVNPNKLRVFFERKGRGGKCATIVTGFDDLTDEQLQEVASKLKKSLGTGGSARCGEILIQGDRQADVKRYFGIKTNKH